MDLGGRTGAVMLVVRPEDARPAAAHPTAVLAGQVVSRSLLGRCWRLEVMVAGTRLRVDWPTPGDIGTELSFSLAPDRCNIVADDGAR